MKTSLSLTAVHLRVRDLIRSLEFYHERLGFAVAAQSSDRAELSAAPGEAPLLTLTAAPSAPPNPRDAAGLFHAALLFPSRPALGAWLAFAAAREIDFDGFSDHGVSEAIYFSDPDRNGLEFYADRPPADWPYAANGEVAMTTRPLDVPALLAAAAPASATPLAGAAWGHLHLRVTDLERSEAFYRAQLGLEVTQRSYPGARFLAADGYHHHLGLNTWGNPVQPRLTDALGLVEATFARTNLGAKEGLIDPDAIHLRVVPLPATDAP